MSSHSVDALIVGAGPVGLLSALCLARNGFTVRIIDRGENTSQESYALALHPSSLHLLETIGLGGDLVARGRRIDGVAIYDNQDRRFEASYASIEEVHSHSLVLPQSSLEAILKKAIDEHGIHIEWNSELTGFDEREESIRARVVELKESAVGYARTDMRRAPAGVREIHARFLIGCDGPHSTVRRLTGTRIAGYEAARHYRVFEFETDADLPNEVALVLHPAGEAVLWPMAEGRARWTFAVPQRFSGMAGLESLQALTESRAPWFTARPTSIVWSGNVDFSRGYANCFAKGRVWLAGDAAHQTSPFGVQSMNAGLTEGAYLASLLTEFDERGEWRSAAERYDADRRAEWRRLLAEDQRDETARPADPFLRQYEKEILASLPATGHMLQAMFGALATPGNVNA